jgi:hypothetical protein
MAHRNKTPGILQKVTPAISKTQQIALGCGTIGFD